MRAETGVAAGNQLFFGFLWRDTEASSPVDQIRLLYDTRRNGKILRRAIRATVLGQAVGDLSSLDNPAVLEEFRGESI